jgi:hypothetical protein
LKEIEKVKIKINKFFLKIPILACIIKKPVFCFVGSIVLTCRREKKAPDYRGCWRDGFGEDHYRQRHHEVDQPSADGDHPA